MEARKSFEELTLGKICQKPKILHMEKSYSPSLVRLQRKRLKDSTLYSTCLTFCSLTSYEKVSASSQNSGPYRETGGHGGRVVTLLPPTSAAGVRSPSWL